MLTVCKLATINDPAPSIVLVQEAVVICKVATLLKLMVLELIRVLLGHKATVLVLT